MSAYALLAALGLVLALAVGGCLPFATPSEPPPTADPPPAPRPPLTPRWAFEPWVWEDEENHATATLDLVDGYRRQGIPVGVVIIDSPWQTNYNTFEFNRDYPDPGGLVRDLHARGVRVLLWATGFVNVASGDGPERGKASVYDEALAAGYFVDGGKTYQWDKGEGSAIDFFNAEAVAWLYARMDRAFEFGIDGWKVDSPEGNLPDRVLTAAGWKTQREYGDAYYRAFYQYARERRPDAIITARPYDAGTFYAPVDANPAGWVGDQIPDWGAQGIEEALDNMLASAQHGYSVVGSDIGGYRPGERFEKLIIRWIQLGALSPVMENGGRGEHRPWRLDKDVLHAYQYYARLHHQLVPYLFSHGVEAHLTGAPIIRDADRDARQYLLGPDLLVAPLVTREDERDVSIPAGRWHDFWDDQQVISGPLVLPVKSSKQRIPLFIRRGAIIPMAVSDAETGHGGPGSAGHLTLLIYPDGNVQRRHFFDEERFVDIRVRQADAVTSVDIDSSSERYILRIKESRAPVEVTVGGNALERLSSWESFDGSKQGWYYDADRDYLWARVVARDAAIQLSYTAR